MKEVDLEEFRRCVEYMRKINQTPFKELTWKFNGKEVEPKTKEFKKLRDEWEFTGLSNCDYGKQLIGI